MLTVIVMKNDCRRHCVQVVASYWWADEHDLVSVKHRPAYRSLRPGMGTITRPGGTYKDKPRPNSILNVRRFMGVERQATND